MSNGTLSSRRPSTFDPCRRVRIRGPHTSPPPPQVPSRRSCVITVQLEFPMGAGEGPIPSRPSNCGGNKLQPRLDPAGYVCSSRGRETGWARGCAGSGGSGLVLIQLVGVGGPPACPAFNVEGILPLSPCLPLRYPLHYTDGKTEAQSCGVPGSTPPNHRVVGKSCTLADLKSLQSNDSSDC